MPHSQIMALDRGYLEHVCPTYPIPGPVGTRLVSFQTRSLSGLHSTSLVVVLGSLLTWPAHVAPCKDCLFWTHSCPVAHGPRRGLLVSGLLHVLGAHPGLPCTKLMVVSGSPFSGNVRLLIIQMFIGQNTERRHSLSPLCCTCDIAATLQAHVPDMYSKHFHLLRPLSP